MTAKKNDGGGICICGHPVAKHELVGTEYARCRLYRAYAPPCNCEGGVRSVVSLVKTEGSGLQTNKFIKYYRGGEEPHALVGGLNKLDKDQYIWMTYSCDLCHGTASTPTPTALDTLGRPMLGRTEDKTDTGHHMLLCESCAEDVRAANLAGTDEAWADLDAELGITPEDVEKAKPWASWGF